MPNLRWITVDSTWIERQMRWIYFDPAFVLHLTPAFHGRFLRLLSTACVLYLIGLPRIRHMSLRSVLFTQHDPDARGKLAIITIPKYVTIVTEYAFFSVTVLVILIINV